MNLLQLLKQQFRHLTPLEVAATELVQAELAKLEAESAKEYADAQVKYNTARITRLRAYVASCAVEGG